HVPSGSGLCGEHQVPFHGPAVVGGDGPRHRNLRGRGPGLLRPGRGGHQEQDAREQARESHGRWEGRMSTMNGTACGGRQVLSLQAMYSTEPFTVKAPFADRNRGWVKVAAPSWRRTWMPKAASIFSWGTGSRRGPAKAYPSPGGRLNTVGSGPSSPCAPVA